MHSDAQLFPPSTPTAPTATARIGVPMHQSIPNLLRSQTQQHGTDDAHLTAALDNQTTALCGQPSHMTRWQVITTYLTHPCMGCLHNHAAKPPCSCMASMPAPCTSSQTLNAPPSLLTHTYSRELCAHSLVAAAAGHAAAASHHTASLCLRLGSSAAGSNGSRQLAVGCCCQARPHDCCCLHHVLQ